MFPKKTEINKPFKTKLVQHLSGIEKKELQQNTEKVTLSNTLRQDTLNVEKGKRFVEIFVFDYFLKDKKVSDNLITAIEKIIPKHIVHILHNKNRVQIVATYKEKGANNQVKVVKIYRTEWIDDAQELLKINGLNIDTIYDNFIEQVSCGKVEIEQETTIKEAVDKSIDKEKLERKINLLENKMNNEKQFNKQLKLKDELKKLKKQLSEI